MREFFHGWRRKLGCVTLVMACVLLGMWGRSTLVVVLMHFDIRDRLYWMESRNGVLIWGCSEYESGEVHVGNGWSAIPTNGPVGSDCYGPFWVTYLHPAIALTLLSALLLLWKPRTRTGSAAVAA